jgi:hypothetical protein
VDELAPDLARWTAEDGGVLFQCRPRGWPALGVGHLVAALTLCWPHVLLGAAAFFSWFNGDPQVLPLPLGWGFESPLFDGVVIPWLGVAAALFVAGELLRVAMYRSRRIVVTPTRVWTFDAFLWPRARARIGGPAVVVGPDGVRLWADGWVAVGRLDPLDLEGLTRALGAPPPLVEPRSLLHGVGAIAAALATVVLGSLVCPLAPGLLVALWLAPRLARGR